MTSSAAILACIAAEQPMSIIYQDAQGIISVRVVQPNSVVRCKNGNTIMRAFDLQRRESRSFTLHRIQRAIVGGSHQVKVEFLAEPTCTGRRLDDGHLTHCGAAPCPVHEA